MSGSSPNNFETWCSSNSSAFTSQIGHLSQRLNDNEYDCLEDDHVANVARDIGRKLGTSFKGAIHTSTSQQSLHKKYQDMDPDHAHRLKLSLIGFVSYNSCFAGIFPNEQKSNYQTFVNCLMVRCILDNNLVIYKDHEKLTFPTIYENEIDPLEYQRMAFCSIMPDSHAPIPSLGTLRRRTFFLSPPL